MLRKRKKNFGRVIVVRRNWITAVSLLLLVAVIFYVVNSPAIVGAAATTRLLPIYSVQRDNKCVSLTYDVKATFFVVGEWVDKYPESVKALSDAGHYVMNHSNDHAHFSTLSTEEIVANINECNDKIEAITGVRPTLFRAPYGEYDDHVISAVNSMGMTTIQWDVDSLDWKEISAEEITQRIESKVQPGSIILFHNAALNTPEALPTIIEYLLSEGYSIVPVTELLLQGDYTIDHTGKQCPA